MRRAPLAAFLVLLVSVLPALHAQQLSPQAATVLSSCSAAMGSAVSPQMLDSVLQGTATNSATPDATPSTFTIKAKGNDQIRWEDTTNGNSSVIVVSHGVQRRLNAKGWHMMASANSIHQRMLHLPALLIGQELTRADLAAAYVADETVNERTVHHVTLTRMFAFKNGNDDKFSRDSQIDVFIDAQTGLIAKISYIHLSETDWRIGSTVEIYYDDYRPVQGMMVPFHQRTIFNHTNTSDMIVTSVKFNNGLADAEFKGGN